MSLGAWVMLAFGVLVLVGGLTACLVVAVRTDRRKQEEGVGFLDEGDE